MDQLKLAALDSEDLQVLSAHLQDAVLIVADIRFLPKEKKAVFVMKRFVWDKEADKRSKQHERRRSALAFAQVRRCGRRTSIRLPRVPSWNFWP